MSTTFDFKKLRRLITIYAVVQVVLVGLLVYVAMNFQAGLVMEGRGFRFMHSIVVTLLMQLALFWPINKFAVREARLAVEAMAVGLTPDELKAQRNKRLMGDVIKSGIFCFYLIFAYRAPADKFFQSMIFFNFILTYLCYFQCFNFAAKREIKARTA